MKAIAKNGTKIGVFVFCMVSLPSNLQATCQCACVNGQAIPLCSSTLDLPPICSPTICPIVPPSVQPLPSVSLKPLGTSYCSNEQVFNNYSGQYEWQRICR